MEYLSHILLSECISVRSGDEDHLINTNNEHYNILRYTIVIDKMIFSFDLRRGKPLIKIYLDTYYDIDLLLYFRTLIFVNYN